MGLGRIVQMLKTSKEFDFVYKNSYKFRTEMLDICVLRANLASDFFAKFRRLPCDMVGFSVSKKVGNAVERNLIKRRLRAICREFFSQRNSSLGMQFRTKNAESSLDSANLQNLIKNNSVRSTQNSPASWCKKSESKGAEVPPADFLLEAEKRGSPPKSEKRQLLARRGSEVGGAALLRKETNKISGNVFAESSTDSMDSATFSQGGLPRRFCESARNDGFLDSSLRFLSAQNDNNMDCHDFASAKSHNDGVRRNLICIFIAKSQILQTPFATLKSIIFDALKKQLNFRQDLHKKPRMSRHNAQNRINQNRALQNPNYNPNKGAL